MGSKPLTASVLATSMLVSGCATQSQNQTTGAVAGSAIGTGLGFLIPYGGGTLLSLAGGYVGSRIGKYLDEKEKAEMVDASIRAAAQAKTGERVNWGEPNPGTQPNSGVQPGSNAQTSSNAQTAPSAQPNSAESSSGNEKPSTAKAPAGSGTRTASHSPAKTSNPATVAASGWVVPVTDVYVTPKGQKCRDLQQVANKGGKTYQQNVQACQSRPDYWIIPQA